MTDLLLNAATPTGKLEPPSQPDQHGFSHTTHSPISKRALEAIEMLQAELQQCHIDLETDEELFSEKVDELNSLQTNYNTLLQEKDRIEQMWTVAMEAEGQLRQDVEQLLERLSALERELSSRDSTIEELRGQLGERGRDEPQETQGGETSTIEVCVPRRSCVPYVPFPSFRKCVLQLWLFPLSRTTLTRRYWSRCVY